MKFNKFTSKPTFPIRCKVKHCCNKANGTASWIKNGRYGEEIRIVQYRCDSHMKETK